MATIVEPKRGTKVSYHTLKVGSGAKSLKLTIHETADTVTLYIGGHDVYCIDFLFYKPDSPYGRIFDVSLGYLSHVYYDMQCSLEHNFRKGLDTHMIMKLLITYIKANYPHIRGIKLKDASYKTCDNDQHILLSEMSYLTTGRTWYEKNFNAYINPTDKAKFDAAVREFDTHKESISWEMFQSFIKGPLPEPISEDALKTAYETSATWIIFFTKLRDMVGVSQFCIFAAPWLHSFVMAIMRFDFTSVEYIIPVDDTHKINYTRENYKRGGRRFTRKQRKQLLNIVE